jgi:hypothetical protein
MQHSLKPIGHWCGPAILEPGCYNILVLERPPKSTKNLSATSNDKQGNQIIEAGNNDMEDNTKLESPRRNRKKKSSTHLSDSYYNKLDNDTPPV